MLKQATMGSDLLGKLLKLKLDVFFSTGLAEGQAS